MVLAHTVSERIRTKDIQILQDVSFDTMLLSSKTLDGLKRSGFYKPSPVQLHGIPMGKCGFDLLLEAKSGTGKTAVFTIIALEKINLDLGLQAIILSPTREIAAQICDVIKHIGSAYTGLCVEVVMGGLPVEDDIQKFSKNNPHIVVGSPGRLKHLIHDKHVDVSAVRLLVLDEADKLMEKCFLNDIKYINSNLPQQKQVIMSSATYPTSCKEYLNQFVHGAQHICPENNSVLLGVSQKVTHVKYNSNIVKQTKIRFEEYVKILSNLPFKQCLTFCNYQARVAELHRMLKKADWPVEMLHGRQDQSDRLDALKTLQEYKCRILISTDLASRGIDASNIDLVINFEPPFEWQTYLHRIGRAGRFGSYGTAITIVSEGNEQNKFINLFKSINSSVALTNFWDSNNIVETTNEIETEDKRKPQSDTEPINTEITVVNSISEHLNLDKIHEYSSLLLTESQTKEEIESFENLLVSYTDYNPADPKVESQYACIELPTITHDKTVLKQPDPIPLRQEPISQTANSELVSILNDPSLLKNKNEQENNDGNDNYNSADLIKLGLPTNFSSSKNKNRTNNFKIKKEVNNNNDKTEHYSSQKASRYRSYHPRYKKTQERNEQRGNLYVETEINKRGRIKKSMCSAISAADSSPESLGSLPASDDDCYENKSKPRTENRNKYKEKTACKLVSRDDSSNRNSKHINSYENWYKQLKLQTKHIELSLYLNELSTI